jgi:DNA polymerase III epsilon subunit-like protein
VAKNWISVDIETSGLDPCVHETIEVGMCWKGGRTNAFSLPFDESKASPRALEVNGWGTRRFARQISVEEALVELDEAFGGGAMLVASPAHFDVGFLEQLFRRLDLSPPWNHRSIIDIKSYALGRIGIETDLRNAEIARLYDLNPLPEDEAHSALNDAVWQAELFSRVSGWAE